MISVIIPIYNTERYLGRCIDSVLDSSYEDFELLLVNDGSQDRSPEICRTYCGRDRRIRLIHQEHQGVSAARNRGIEECRGEWIVFLDSDDFISADFLNMVVQEEYEYADMLIFDYQKMGKKAEQAAAGRNMGKESVFRYDVKDRIRLAESLLNGTQLEENGNMNLLSTCAKAYKRSVLERDPLRFSTDLMFDEDRLFNMEYLLKMQSCVYIQKKVCFIEPRPDSAMRGFYLEFPRNDIRYQKLLKDVLRKQGVFAAVEKAYYNSVLSCMGDVLVRGIFHPGSTRSRQENYRLCRAMRGERLYRQALKYNRTTGALARRVLLFFFRMECCRTTELISKVSYRVLEGRREL